jgi:hypothetical protein
LALLYLLLLIFVVSCGVASVRRRKLVLLQFACVTVSVWRGGSGRKSSRLYLPFRASRRDIGNDTVWGSEGTG